MTSPLCATLDRPSGARAEGHFQNFEGEKAKVQRSLYKTQMKEISVDGAQVRFGG